MTAAAAKPHKKNRGANDTLKTGTADNRELTTDNSPSPYDPQLDAAAVIHATTDSICASPFQPLARSASEAFLAEIQAAGGLLHPISIRKLDKPNRYELIAGQRRLDAYRKLKWATIPARLIDADDARCQLLIAIENLAREDLPPLAEAQTIAALLDQAGQTIESVAAQLGHTPKWIAKRRALLNLTPDWQGHIQPAPRRSILNGAPPEPTTEPWPLAHYLAVAALPPMAQDQLFNDIGDAGVIDRQDLDWNIERQLNKLAAAPFDLADAELLPVAGPCTTCPKRAGANAYLWHDLLGEVELDQTANDQCLDQDCYGKKCAAYAKAELETAAAKVGSKPLIQVDYNTPKPIREALKEHAGNKRIVDAYARRTVKKDTPGAERTLVFDSHGQAKGVWTLPASNANGSASGKERPRDENGDVVPKPLKLRRQELRRRRYKLAVDKIREALDDEAFDPKGDTCKLSELDLLRLLVVFGTEDNRKTNHGYSNMREGDKPTKHFDGLKSIDDCHARLWESVRGVFHTRFDCQGPIATTATAENAWSEAAWLCGLLGLKPQHFLDLAEAELPEPKSWKR